MAGPWLVVLFVVMGAGQWLAGYRAHRADKDRRLLPTRLSPVLAWLCGGPRRDGTLELDLALGQLSALALLSGAPASRARAHRSASSSRSAGPSGPGSPSSPMA
jgi:hypothetical protein